MNKFLLFAILLIASHRCFSQGIKHGTLIISVTTKNELVIVADKRVTDADQCTHTDTITKIFPLNKYSAFSHSGINEWHNSRDTLDFPSLVKEYFSNHKVELTKEGIEGLFNFIDRKIAKFTYGSQFAKDVTWYYVKYTFYQYQPEGDKFVILPCDIIFEKTATRPIAPAMNAHIFDAARSLIIPTGEDFLFHKIKARNSQNAILNSDLMLQHLINSDTVYCKKNWAIKVAKRIIVETNKEQLSIPECNRTVGITTDVYVIDKKKGGYWYK